MAMTTTVVPIELGEVHLPDWHPRAAVGTALLPGFVVRHPDGVIVSTPGHTPEPQCAVDLTDVHDGP